ncbi:AraC family transcriptional regulator [Bauldia sp.]|uniref:AraC family transcriptional regulator n=1 Tax=Bauldia sp. TaxID=2575872 RepID=UPI003BAACE99
MGNSVLDRLAAYASTMKVISLPRAHHRLHTMPTSAGYEIREDEPYDCHGRRRGQTPFAVLQHTVSGTGNLTFERRRHRLGAGDTMLVIVPHDHRYWLEPGDRWAYFWIALSGREAIRICRAIQATAGPVLRLNPDCIEAMASACLRLVEGSGETPGAASAIAYEATAVVYDAVFGPQSIIGAEAEGDAVGRVVAFIHENLGGSLGVDHLAAVAGLSRAHFSRVFAASEGLPPAEYVIQARMHYAARLLTGHAVMPVKEIAPLCGFADPNYFAKVFRRFFGASPSEFRTTGLYLHASLDSASLPRREDRVHPRSPSP